MSATKATRKKKAPATDGFLELLTAIWNDAQPLVGSMTLSALLSSAVRRASREHPGLAKLAVSVRGIDVDAFARVRTRLGAGADAAFAEVVQNLLALFDSVAGPIIVKQMFPTVLKAERMIGAARGRE
jgi:hypothetical protein